MRGRAQVWAKSARGRRVLLLLSLPLGAGAAMAGHQVLTGDGWSWAWTGITLAVAGIAALAAFRLTRASAAEPDPQTARPARGRGQGAQPTISAAGEGSVVIGSDNSGIISTGSGASNIQMSARASGQSRVYQAGGDLTVNETVLPAEALRPVEQVDAPSAVVNVPVHAGVFVGRAPELAEVERALEAPGPVVVAAVHGLGGIGKSTLAAQYALGQARERAVNPVWWITADSPASIEAGLSGLAAALQPELAGLPAPVLAERALGWLACHRGWLLVLDNLPHPGHVTGLLARTPAGRVLATSRLATGWHHLGASVLRLDVLQEAEAVDLLTRIATGAGVEGAAELVRELGCLPLAVEQAGAYLRQNHLSASAYLELLTARPAVMYDQAAEGGDAGRTIGRIWRLTLDRLSDTPLAGQLLRILAWYAPAQIPRTLLDDLAEAPVVQQALGRLAAYNMITLDEEGITVHRLVQAVARTPDPGDPHRQEADIHTARDRATRLLSDAQSGTDYGDPAGWPARRALLPHISALADHAPAGTDTPGTAYLLNETGLFVEDQGNLPRAIEYYQRAATAYQRTLGTDHPDTLTSRNNLAHAFRVTGDLDRAIPLHGRTLADRERVLGVDHPDTLSSRNNLARAHLEAGDLSRATALFEQTLADRERVLGADHPHTLTSRESLASAYEAAGDLGRAIPLYEQAVAELEGVLGVDHPHTLTTRDNLACAYESAGDPRRAIPLHELTLADRERILGADHPHTLTSRNNLAYAHKQAGDLSRATLLYEQTLADRERVLGADHPHTLASRNNLAAAYRAAGDLDRAIRLDEQTLADRERVLGPDHPDTFSSRNNLAAAYRTAGDLKRAIPLHEQALSDCERVLGPDHTTTLTARFNLAAGYRRAGDLQRAMPLYEQALAGFERVLGSDHPTTETVRGFYLEAAEEQGQAET
ncbi:tetratricopeptide repeat protein [Nonomuraea typhae]|uniref:tetratricopeptide repeat protein n=1 Tax=Nonomuraea typhae TaxID=2603600 RepID=UPI001CA5F434|nr:tetratricopeptide repeat protein [Nonomuraea typhae]